METYLIEVSKLNIFEAAGKGPVMVFPIVSISKCVHDYLHNISYIDMRRNFNGSCVSASKYVKVQDLSKMLINFVQDLAPQHIQAKDFFQ